MSDYFTAPTAPESGSRARSALISDLISAVEDGFDALPAGLTADDDVGAHEATTDAHSSTAAATADRIVLRDSQGRAKIANPSVDADITNKGSVDTLIATRAAKSQTEASTATATTTALGSTTTKHLLTGTTTITGFTGTDGVTYSCRADAAFTLTHHATDLIITQGAANITTVAGDTFDVQMITETTCRIVNYQYAEAGTKSVLATFDLSSASGTFSVTGAGFKPSAAHLFGTVDNEEYHNIFSFLQDGSAMSMCRYNPAGGPYWVHTADLKIGKDNTNFQRARDSDISMTSDGVDIDFTKNESPTGTMYLMFLFFR
jgi:hypothetical protein